MEKNKIDMNSIISEFRNMSLEEQKNCNLKLLKEIEYMIICKIHHKLGHLVQVKGCYSIPYEDINFLKTISDSIKQS